MSKNKEMVNLWYIYLVKYYTIIESDVDLMFNNIIQKK